MLYKNNKMSKYFTLFVVWFFLSTMIINDHCECGGLKIVHLKYQLIIVLATRQIDWKHLMKNANKQNYKPWTAQTQIP